MERCLAPLSVMVFIAFYTIWLFWLSDYPFQLSSDDALNFARAVERYSVLEFRPHFPGYPVFVGMSRLVLLMGIEHVVNVVVSFCSMSLLPLLMCAIIRSIGCSVPVAIFGSLLIMTQPLMASLALNGLSDSLAMMFLLFALLLVIKKQYVGVGFCLGLMLATRPSYFPLAFVFLWMPLVVIEKGHRKRAYIKATISVFFVGLISGCFLWAKDGYAYFSEGIRFTQGHFLLWGNTVISGHSTIIEWFNVLYLEYQRLGLGIIFLSIMAMVASFQRSFGNKTAQDKAIRWQMVFGLIYIVYLFWVLSSQNPNSMRHWAPIFLLFSLMLSVQLECLMGGKLRFVSGVFLLVYFGFLGSKRLDFNVEQAPVQQAINWIKLNPQMQNIGTNYHVNLIRNCLKDRSVYDMYYPSSEFELENNNEPTWRLSSSRLAGDELITQFPARFTGEKSLYLYKISQ